MVEETGPEGAATRYDGYIAELREFFASRSVRFGQPGDVVAFAALVSEPGPFGDEMGSMLRSFLYYEDERMSREDLLSLVTAAVADSPLQPELPGLEDALRQLFRFVNGALRQRGSMIPSEVDDEPAMQGGDPVNGNATAGGSARVTSSGPTEPWREAMRARPTGAGDSMLLRAVTMSEHAAAIENVTTPWEPPPAQAPPAEVASPVEVASPAPATGVPRRAKGKVWLLPAGAFAGAAGVLLYLFWPWLMHLAGARGGRGAKEPGNPAMSAARSCVPRTGTATSRAALEERSFVAHNLLDQQMYGAAMQQLHAIATADPGFPGVYLDESDAFLQMKQPERAREAIDAQIGLSECLAGLPGPSLDAYCATQFSSSTVGACRPQLAHIRQAAELQAALVHLELGHRVDADDGAAAAMKQLQQDDASEAAGTRPARGRPRRGERRR